MRPGYRETFARLALGQSPDVLFFACSDSRVVPNLFASSDPGDLFVVRSVGNLIPPSGAHIDESEAAALEFALLKLDVDHIVVCGHSHCGAMQALAEGSECEGAPHLRAWLRHGAAAVERPGPERPDLDAADRLSQRNVLQQLDHLRGYPVVAERVAAGRLTLHGWWFELATADVHAWEEDEGRFVLIDEAEAARILARLG